MSALHAANGDGRWKRREYERERRLRGDGPVDAGVGSAPTLALAPCLCHLGRSCDAGHACASGRYVDAAMRPYRATPDRRRMASHTMPRAAPPLAGELRGAADS